ncbi:MAG: TolB protein [Bermanella sp.]|jgi:TolB protein
MRIFAACLMLFASLARAELTIEITRGSDKPVSIAIVPFGWDAGVALPDDIAGIVSSDLHRSGQFEPFKRADMLSQPQKDSEVFYRDWRALGVDYLVIGRTRATDWGYSADYALFDVNQQRKIISGEESGGRSNTRDIAHAISDQVYEKITNIKGAFGTKLLYVSARRLEGTAQQFRLVMSDIDGFREKVLLEQLEPIMTPSWSPNGKIVTYVSFETTRPGVYLHNLETGQRIQLTNYPGINGSPAWSPDGKSLAMVLSKDGNPEIYVMDIKSQALRRVTNHFAIDTEPDWMEDGKSLIFTSDRGGKPQIYKVDIASGRVQRLTFEGDYNARGRVLAGGEGIVMVHRVEGKFHIAVQDLKTGRVSILTETTLDESPSMAPNNTILLYATKHNGRGVLGAVSIDGNVRYRLPSEYGDVREPAWSPFLR